MTHDKIYEKFKLKLMLIDSEIDCWYPNGKNSIRIRSYMYGEMIFTYQSKDVWKIESVESYLNSIKVEVTK